MLQIGTVLTIPWEKITEKRNMNGSPANSFAVDYRNVYSLGEADVELTMRNTTHKEDKRKQV